MNPDVLNQIECHVRGGFVPIDDISRIVLETWEFQALDPDEVHGLVRTSGRALRKQARTWPEMTDCDRLDAAFRALFGRRVIALQNTGLTQSDGYDDVRTAAHSHPEPTSVVGYCFFHGQDLELAVQGKGLYLAFGPMDPILEQTMGPQVGRMVVEEVERVGLQTEWNGTISQRILVRPLDWKRRRTDW